MNTLSRGGTLGLENLSLSEATMMRLFLVQRKILPHLSKVAYCKQNPNNQPRRNCKSLAFSLWPARQCRVSPGVWSSWPVPVKELGFRLPHSIRGTTGVSPACVLASSSFFTFVLAVVASSVAASIMFNPHALARFCLHPRNHTAPLKVALSLSVNY